MDTIDLSANQTDISSNQLSQEHIDIIKYVCSQTSLSHKSAYDGLMKYEGDYEKVIHMANIYEMAQVIMRQTTYSLREAINKLHEHKGEPLEVIKEFIGAKEDKTIEKKSTNQMVFTEIRDFMDEVNRGYEKRKKRDIAIQKLRDRMNTKK